MLLTIRHKQWQKKLVLKTSWIHLGLVYVDNEQNYEIVYNENKTRALLVYGAVYSRDNMASGIKGASDILELFEKIGHDVFRMVDGSWAMVLIDLQTHELGGDAFHDFVRTGKDLHDPYITPCSGNGVFFHVPVSTV